MNAPHDSLPAADWRENATFIGGHRKSGTTLLLSLFDSHPGLCVFPPDSGFFYAYYPLCESGDLSDEEKKTRIVEVMFKRLGDGLTRLGTFEGAPFPFDLLETRFRERMAGRSCSPRNLLLEAICAFDDVRPSLDGGRPQRWVEKTSSTEIYAGEVFDWYPHAKFIHVIRDPRDNFASLKSGWRARYQHHNDTVERLLQSMLDRGLLGMKLAALNRDRHGADRYKVIRYEDLTTRPEGIMRDLCGFLGIAYDEILLRPTYAGRLWKGNNFDGLEFDGPSSVNVGRWRERITDHEAKVIEFYFEQEMVLWGYEPVFGTAERIDAARAHYKWYNYAQKFSVLRSELPGPPADDGIPDGMPIMETVS